MTEQNDEKHHLSNLFEVGIERLKLIGDNANMLMQGYLQGGIDPAQLSERTLRRLVSARVLYQPEDGLELKLRQPVIQLVAALVTDESRRAINTDIADKLLSIRGFVEGLREAQRMGDSLRADSQMQRIDEAVHDLTSQFEEAIFSLWHRLNSNFGFVSNLSDKIRENDRAQQQIKRLIDGLSLIEFDELIELAEGNPTLRKILVSRLQQQMSAHHSSLLEVQKRLVELMTRFREQQERSLLVVGMAGFLREHPGFKVGDYSYRSHIPSLVNRAAPIIPTAAVALDRREQYPELAHLVHSLYQELALKAKTEVVSVAAEAVNVPAQLEQVERRQQQLHKDAESYFLHACEVQQPVSALQYLTEQKLPWPAEIWLFQVLAEYDAFTRADQKYFVLTRDERKSSAFNHVQIIEDIEVRYQAA